MKIKNTFFQIAKLRISTIFENIPKFSKNSQGNLSGPRRPWQIGLMTCIFSRNLNILFHFFHRSIAVFTNRLEGSYF